MERAERVEVDREDLDARARAWLDINAGRQHVANNPFKFGRNLGGTMMGNDNSDFFL